MSIFGRQADIHQQSANGHQGGIGFASLHTGWRVSFLKILIENTVNNLEKIIKDEFLKITYTEAIEKLEKSDENFEFPVKWGIDMQSEHEKYLSEKVYNKPLIIIDYPKEIKAFYMKMNDDNKTVTDIHHGSHYLSGSAGKPA